MEEGREIKVGEVRRPALSEAVRGWNPRKDGPLLLVEKRIQVRVCGRKGIDILVLARELTV